MSDTKSTKYLIVCFRNIGDVLVTTPLALSIKTASPDATVDYLVFEGTEKAITKNPHIRNIITIPKNQIGFKVLLKLFRCYDIAIAAYPSDRTALCAILAGKVSLGITHGRRNEWWKYLLFHLHYVSNDLIHVVSNMQMLAHLMAITPVPHVTVGYDDKDTSNALASIATSHYIVLHPYSMKRVKYWNTEKWGALASMIHQGTDYKVVFAVLPSDDDNDYLHQILSFAPSDVICFESSSMNQFAAVLKGCGAYVGIDTAATHVAAACGVPTIALYGPSLTRYWGPWVNECQEHSPFSANKGRQHLGNVTILQKDWECIPCNQEPCRISMNNRVECMEAITPEEVFREVEVCVSRAHQAQPI